MKDVTRFDWDELFVFKYTAALSTREAVVRQRLSDNGEFHGELIFLKNGKVVWRENQPTNIERPVQHGIIFDIADSEQYRKYMRDARFSVNTVVRPDVTYYELHQLQ